MSWANRLTLLRVLLIPVFLLFMYLNIPYANFYAAIVFFIASMTDILDGYMARKEKKVTVFGKVFDPIADKLLVLSALVILTELKLLPSIITIVIIAREILISGFRIVMAEKGEVISASWLGKTKTTLQDVAIILILLANCGIGFFNFLNILYLTYISMGGAIVFTLWSTVDYLKGNLKNFSTEA
jgi:CDP-diacylglycerol---glycerol-3-phosphate 3-phosphatidyltransferase